MMSSGLRTCGAMVYTAATVAIRLALRFSPRLKPVKVLSRPRRQFLDLAPAHMGPGVVVQVLYCGGEGSSGDLLRNSASYLVRVQFRRQVQIGIQGVQAVHSLSPVAQALHLQLAKNRLQSALMHPFLLPGDTIGACDGR
jgi:hypothetical protein